MQNLHFKEMNFLPRQKNLMRDRQVLLREGILAWVGYTHGEIKEICRLLRIMTGQVLTVREGGIVMGES